MKTIRHSDSERGLQQEDQDGEEQPEDLREESFEPKGVENQVLHVFG